MNILQFPYRQLNVLSAITQRTTARNKSRRRTMAHTLQMEAMEDRRLLAATPELLATNPIGVGSQIANFGVTNDNLFFAANDSVHGKELWKTDGTEAGTMLVKDMAPGDVDSNPGHFVDDNGTAFFLANDGTHGTELWKSDGTSDGTVMVSEIRLGIDGANANNLTHVNGRLFFTADDGVHGSELWVSDGTAVGTVMVKDIRIGESPYGGPASSVPQQLTEFNGTLFFVANDGTGSELWKSDGTSGGTVMVKDIGTFEFSFPSAIKTTDETLFFEFISTDANTFQQIWTLWKTDGTETGTVPVKEVHNNSTSSCRTYSTRVGGQLFFTADNGRSRVDLWKTDGTEAGTVLVEE